MNSRRDLTEVERAALAAMLGVDFPGREVLAGQIPYTSVIGRCEYGCATIDLAVDPSRAAPARTSSGSPVTAAVSGHGDQLPGMVLFVDATGYLSRLEIYSISDDPVPEFPAPAQIHPEPPPTPRLR